MENIELLKKVRIFQGLSDDELKKFGPIVGEEQFPPQAVIIEEGMEGRALFIIRRGTVTVTKIDGEVETELVKLVAGEEFGEMSLVEDTVTSARVTAYNDVECLIINREPFMQLLNNDLSLSNKVFRNFTKVLSERLRNTSSELVTWKPDIAF
ncbi:MAG TPA: cyclic nucleotide-binding domain-containing protein [bacterium]|nr:cyclic nucleotide-binding domain-containing protein [bacterium]